jgi:DNA-binding MarR family transcriptional regulator
MTDSKSDQGKPTLGHLLAQVCRIVGRRRSMKLESIGLHPAQGMILFRLWQNDGIAQSVLARALHITPPTASSTLQRMERDGWVQRRRDEADQRIVRVYLTDKARRLHEEARASFRELDQEMRTMLTDQEHETLRQSLLKVLGYLSRADTEDTDGLDCGRQRSTVEGEQAR